MFHRSAARLPILVSLALLLCLAGAARAQQRRSVSGTVTNAETGEALIGATVGVQELKGVGASTNAYGFYSLTLPAGSYTLRVQYLGYTTKLLPVAADRDRTLPVALVPEPVKLGEVLVSGERSNRNVVSTETATQRIAMRDVMLMPALLGERDILKTIQLLPGIKSAGEGNTGFIARGGAVDQNLILLDEAQVYNAAHLLGYLSIFNADAIKDVKLITGGIPAQYGGRLSSVLDIRTIDGNDKAWGGTAGIGLIDSRLMLQGPIVKDEGSVMMTGRRTYADLFLRLSSDTLINRTRLYFYDFNLKANYRLGDNDRIYVSGYTGKDNFDYPDVFGFQWGNTTATARWNHVFGKQLFSNLSFIYSNYDYSNSVGSGTNTFVITSGIQDFNLKGDFQYYVHSENTVAFGFDVIHHTFIPGSITSGPAVAANALAIPHKYALENALYATQEVQPLQNLRVNYGLRVSFFGLMGPGTFYRYDGEGDVVDSSTAAGGSFEKTFVNLEPRFSANYQLDENTSVKTSYTRTAQYLHLLSNSTISNPSDLWLPSGDNIPPQQADQVSLGYFRNFEDNEYEGSAEAYYKSMKNIIDYRNGADLQLNPDAESMLEYGAGRSYGVELLLRKRYGTFSGWVAYTLSRSVQEFANINGGAEYPAHQDRTHDVSVVGIYKYNDDWTFAATWVYHTGNAVSFPSGNYMVNGRLVSYYTERNAYRMPAYHRLDLSATWTLGPKSNLNFSIYNAYNRSNAFAVYFRQSRTDRTKTEAVQLTLFPIIPSVTYNLTF